MQCHRLLCGLPGVGLLYRPDILQVGPCRSRSASSHPPPATSMVGYQVLGEPALAWAVSHRDLADRVGRRPVLLFGLCGGTFCVVMFGISGSILQAIMWRFLSGILNGRRTDRGERRGSGQER